MPIEKWHLLAFVNCRLPIDLFLAPLLGITIFLLQFLLMANGQSVPLLNALTKSHAFPPTANGGELSKLRYANLGQFS
jgi:hypothetical protein